ncbi:hypothetical protein B0T25DRAFT_628873 [Lasiosphaeria hispida]|uniref:Uncharacterized protein n=1 Tax=Lasiosphaeria hispida TaxID=260671 RepID=A0AAJ0HQN8_9PEZI|nr:hypothetical protein B0T25DRAFT_628873 [Lasiosphaeria hispida]
MCKTWPNNRWACYETRRCRPRHPLLPGLDLGPGPWEEHCDWYDYGNERCGRGTRRECRSDAEINQLVLMTIECPKHHAKRMAHLQEAWDEEWRVQIVEARPGDSYRRAALARKEFEDDCRDQIIRDYLGIKGWLTVGSSGIKELPERPSRKKGKGKQVEADATMNPQAESSKAADSRAADNETAPQPAPDKQADEEKTPTKRGFKFLFENRGKKFPWWSKKAAKANEHGQSAVETGEPSGGRARTRNRAFSFSAKLSDLTSKDLSEIFGRDREAGGDGDGYGDGDGDEHGMDAIVAGYGRPRKRTGILRRSFSPQVDLHNSANPNGVLWRQSNQRRRRRTDTRTSSKPLMFDSAPASLLHGLHCLGEPRIEPCVGAMTVLPRGQKPRLCNPPLPAPEGEVALMGIKCQRDRRDRVGRRKLSHHKAWLREAEAERDRFWKHKIFSPLKKDASQRRYAEDLRQEAEEELERNMVAWERDAELYGISLYDSYDRWFSCLKDYTKRRLHIESRRASTSMSKM